MTSPCQPILVVPRPDGSKYVVAGFNLAILTLEQSRVLVDDLMRAFPDPSVTRGRWRVEYWQDGRVVQSWHRRFSEALHVVGQHKGAMLIDDHKMERTRK